MNSYRGETSLTIGDQELILVFDWNALARVKSTMGSEGQAQAMAGDLELLAQLVAIGLRKHQPEWDDANAIMSSSPPVTKTITAVDNAMLYAYFGPDGEPPETDDENPPQPPSTLLKRLWRWLTVLESRSTISG